MTFNQKLSGELSIKNLTDKTTAEIEQSELLFIYEKLREEILQNDTSILQILGFTLVIISATMGYTFKEATKDIFKVIAIVGLTGIIALSTIQTIRKLNRTFVIASYLKNFIEPKLKVIKWETHLSFYRLKISATYNHQQSSALFTYKYVSLINVLISAFYTYLLYQFHLEDVTSELFYISVIFTIANISIWIFIWKNIHNHLKEIKIGIDENWQSVAKEHSFDF